MIQLKQLQGWQGRINVNGTEYDTVNSVPDTVELVGATITLLPKVNKEVRRVKVEDSTDNREHLITVKQWLTQPATLEFDYNDRMNKGVPMPLRTMQGTIVKETAKSVYMHLHGSTKPVVHCMRCGRELTNPISRHYGLGIECIQKVGIVADINEVEKIKEQLVKIEGYWWIPKSSILSDEIVEADK